MAKVNQPNAQQSYRTPRAFLDAVEREYGRITWDAACTAQDCVNPRFGSFGYLYPGVDALTRDWSELRNCLVWCNPPFGKSGEFCRKAAEAQRPDAPVRILMLVQAAVDSDWFRQYVHGKAFVRPLSPRIAFTHPDGSPVLDGRGKPAAINRPLMLAEYGFGRVGFEPWRWK